METADKKELRGAKRSDQHGDMDGRYAWVILVATFLSFFICGGFLQTTGILHTAFLERFKDNVAKTSWAGSVFIALLSLTAPAGSALIDRYNCRVAVMTGASLVTLGFLLTGIAPNIELCIFSYGILTGTGAGIVFAVLFVVNGFNFKERLNLAQGISLSGTGLGLFVLAPFLETCKLEYGYTGLCFILAGIAMQMIVCGALMRPSVLEQQLKLMRSSNQIKKTLSFKQTFRAKTEMYSSALCNGYVILLCLSMFFFCGGVYTMFLHWPLFCVERGLSAMQSSLVLSTVGLVSVGGRICTGIVASLRQVSERTLYTGSLVLFGASLVLFFLFSRTFAGHLALALIVGLTNGSVYVVIVSFTARGVGVQFLASAVGLNFMFGGVGSIVVPVISGYMIQAGVSYELIFSLCGLCHLISAVLGFITKFVRTDRPGTETVAVSIDNLEENKPEKKALVETELTTTNLAQPETMSLENDGNTQQHIFENDQDNTCTFIK